VPAARSTTAASSVPCAVDPRTQDTLAIARFLAGLHACKQHRTEKMSITADEDGALAATLAAAAATSSTKQMFRKKRDAAKRHSGAAVKVLFFPYLQKDLAVLCIYIYV